MKALKKSIALCLALASVVSVTACGGGNGDVTTTEAKTEWTGDQVTLPPAEIEKKVDISGTTLQWLGTYDLNPTNQSNERSVALSLFEDEYGAKIEWIPTSTNTRFDDLATAIMSDNSPDLFLYEWLAFPYGVSQGQYQPIDDIVDWDSPLWADVKDYADQFVYEGKHYIAPIMISDSSVITYNRTMLEDEGLPDPYELYLKGEWDWNVFVDMMRDFCSVDPENRTGITGWWCHALMQSTGTTFVTWDGKEFKNNLNDERLEKAQLLMEDIVKQGYAKPMPNGWIGYLPEDRNTLFFGMGTWSLSESFNKNAGDDIFVVPFPKSPDTDKYYWTSNMDSTHMWVAGSDKGEAVGVWFECMRREQTEEKYAEARKEKALANNSYTEEVYDFMQTWRDPNVLVPLFEYSYGISTRMGKDVGETKAVINVLNEGIFYGYEGCETWAQVKESYSSIIDEEIAVYNK